MSADEAGVQFVPAGSGELSRRSFLVLLGAASLGVTVLVCRGIWRSYRGPDLAAERLAERRRYYEKVLRDADLSFVRADFWEAVPR